MVSIIEVNSDYEISQFIDFPYTLYPKQSLWVPPLKNEEKFLQDTNKHPFWKTARCKRFLALDNNKVVGRISAIIDDKYNEYVQESCGAFGFFECQNNKEAAHALFTHASSWLKEQGMPLIRGPLNPSMNYTCGMLVQGFDIEPSIMMPYNPPYYPELLESWRFRKEEDLIAYIISKENINISNQMQEDLINYKENSEFSFRSSNKKSLKQDVQIMLDIYRSSWAKNWGFSPLSKDEESILVKELTSILDPEFFILFFHKDTPAAGMVALPNLNPLLKRLNGKLGISLPWHYFLSRNEIKKQYRIILFGIMKEFRMQGLPLLLFDCMLKKVQEHKNIESIEGSWILERNNAMNNIIEDFSGQLYKRYRIYRKDI